MMVATRQTINDNPLVDQWKQLGGEPVMVVEWWINDGGWASI